MSQTPQWSVRPAEAGDLQEVVSFVQNPDELFFCYPAGHWPLTVGQLAATMAERRDNSVLLLNNRLAGFANLRQWHYGDYCELGNLIVAPWAREQGAAGQLMAHMEQFAQQHYQARSLQVACFNHNSAGLLLYRKLGYQLHSLSERLSPQGERVALIQLHKPLCALNRN
ncbi:GNAT family N-acetyltransferase [Pseudomonas sp. 5P_3.1_Bac2]|uniref:GNAT family N-acetyltransferase n=1 Tax=Pseudomonas sp. 5P_3.1_Bac2 TaxID=2971617 RepID=UPI0021C76197|nr:GNAT family N-acetyltransferase [Pseudomonas sp. 5P_3.1_Bac2]MCU1719375.1 GNAT family N-acetyltransferase [Pseudomonas sp. 5P_3.1_Bac2]